MPSTSYSFEIDPNAVLGVVAGASLQEIHEAYRAKALKHHPDRGGDEWAFRIIVRAYELLGASRIAGRAHEEATKASTAQPAPPRPAPPEQSEWLKPGRRDSAVDPAKIVDVEILLLRFELRNPLELVMLSVEERNLSCCLNLSWRATEKAGADGSSVTHSLEETVAAIAAKTKANSSWSNAGPEEFEGWLSYDSATRAWESFRELHQALNRQGLGVNQWTREMLIPRPSR